MQLVVHAPVRLADQPRLGPRPAQEVLRRLRLRAAGGGQRGGDRALARAAAQLPARGGVRLPAPEHRARRADPGAAARRRCSRRAGAGTRSARCCSSARATASACRPPLLRMRADDLLAAAFPQVAGLPGDAARRAHRGADGPPDRAPDDRGLPHRGDGRGRLPRGAARACATARIERRAVDTAEPSAFARGILVRAAVHVPRRRAARGAPHPGGDDAAHPRRAGPPTSWARSTPTRSRACARRPGRSPRAPRRCTRRCSGWATSPPRRRAPWQPWLDDARRGAAASSREGDRWFAVEATRDPKAVLRGRLEALGPVFVERARRRGAAAASSRREGAVLRARIDGRQAWCDRRLLARIHRYTLDRLRTRDRARHRRRSSCASSPAGSTSTPSIALEGPRGVAEVVEQLAGFEVPAAAWEGERPARARARLQARVAGPAHAVGRGRLGAAVGRRRRRRSARTPIASSRARTSSAWPALAARRRRARAAGADGARPCSTSLRARGAMFVQELARAARLPAASRRGRAWRELVAPGRVTCDSFGGLRWLLVPACAAARRGPDARAAGACSRATAAPAADAAAARVRRPRSCCAAPASSSARRWPRERMPGALARRRARLPHAGGARRDPRRPLRGRLRRRAVRAARGRSPAARGAPEGRAPLGSGPLEVSAADPLNFQGILTPDERVASYAELAVRLA